jgi:hypothetical protein
MNAVACNRCSSALLLQEQAAALLKQVARSEAAHRAHAAEEAARLAAEHDRDRLLQQCSGLQQERDQLVQAAAQAAALQQQLLDQTALNATLNRDRTALKAKLEGARIQALMASAQQRSQQPSPAGATPSRTPRASTDSPFAGTPEWVARQQH